ncbi:MAG: DUF4493 domain-containing protein [Odoribacter sp.]|nr:DUF4493 domain-containing protein [Odoribacter sp.]
MKKTMLKGFVGVALATVPVACTDGNGLGFGESGKIALTTEVDATVVKGRSSRAEYTDITPADLSLKLVSADGSFSQTYDKIADFPLDKTFKVGTYTMSAFYGDENTEGFESPSFYGETTLRVTENETTPVHIISKVNNALVTIVYTDNFKDYMTSYSAEVHAAGGSYIEYAAEETRPAYVKTGETEIFVDFVKPNGNGGKLSVAKFTTVAACHYTVTVDLGGDGAGTINLIVKLDETLDQKDIEIDISDPALNAPAPVVTAQGFTSDTAIEFVPGQELQDNLKFNIIAAGGLNQVTMTTRSSSLISKGWPQEVALVGADAAMQQTLTSLGLKALGVFGVTDKMAVVDLTDVLANIEYLNSGDNESIFTISVKDVHGKVSESVTLKVMALPVKMEISDPVLYVGSNELTFNLEFNAGDPAQLVKFSYQNSRGTWQDFNASIEKTGENLYKVTGTAGEAKLDSEVLKLRATAESIGTVTVEIERQPLVMPGNGAVDAYATRANLPVTIGAKDSDAALLATMMSNATVMLSTDGGKTFTAAQATADAADRSFAVEGLTPGTEYTYKIQNGSVELADPVTKSFTSEVAEQIPNGSLDAEAAIVDSYGDWEQYSFEGWGTNNPMTTSQGRTAYENAYNAISGTKPTDDAVSGKAVQIKTNGWGSTNRAYTGISGLNKYVDAGLLHLGSSRDTRPSGYGDMSGSLNTDDLECGIEFPSRPSSISFYAKYSAKNAADHGEALVQVIGTDGAVIAQGSTEITSAADSYIPFTIPLTYTSAAKAAKIYVRFMSTNVSTALTKNADWITGPGFANTSRGEYAGSTLFIDEIVCNYN